MIEPTESESKAELDRFLEAMATIRNEIKAIEDGELNVDESPLKFAPHTANSITQSTWDRKYSRKEAVFPSTTKLESKYWPPVERIDNALGDRNLVCSCPPISNYELGS